MDADIIGSPLGKHRKSDQAEINRLRAENAELEARVVRLEQVLEYYSMFDRGEKHPWLPDIERELQARVARLEGWIESKRKRFKGGEGNYIIQNEITDLLNESPRQSAAELRAGALDQFGRRWGKAPRNSTEVWLSNKAEEEANRIREEADNA